MGLTTYEFMPWNMRSGFFFKNLEKRRSHGDCFALIVGIGGLGKHNVRLLFRMKKDLPIRKVLAAYCKRRHVDYRTVTLLLNGSRVRLHQTVAEGGDTKRRKMDMDLDIPYVEYWTNNEADFIKLLEQACLGDYSMGNPELKVDFKDFWCNFTSELRRRCEIPIHVTDEAVQSCMEYANVSLRTKYRGYEGSSGAVLDAGTRDRLNNIFGKCNLYFPPVFTSVSSQSGRSRSSDASVPNYSNPAVRPIPDCLKAELAAAYHQLRNDGVMNAKDCGKVDTFISMTEVTILWFLSLSQTDKETKVRNILRN